MKQQKNRNVEEEKKMSIYRINTECYYVAPSGKFKHFLWATKKNILIFFGLGALRVFDSEREARKGRKEGNYE